MLTDLPELNTSGWGRQSGRLTPKKFGVAVLGISGFHFWSPLLFFG